MINEISKIENSVFKKTGLIITNIQADSECEEYLGYSFQLNQSNIKFRKAKITPKKIGQFVTLWKRNPSGQTEPFSTTDNFDFYIIATEQENKNGFFIFPKSTLEEKHILTNSQKEGKRGFRVYPDWDLPENKQAEKTKNWQALFFIELTKNDKTIIKKFEEIFNGENRMSN